MRWIWALILGCGLGCGLVGAQAEELTGETWRLLEGTVAFDGLAQDDFFALGNEITLSGEFKDDVWAGGRFITVSGTIDEDLRLLSLEMLTVDGTVGGNLRAISSIGNLLINTNAVVKGNAVLTAGKRATVKGRVEGDLWIEAPNATLEAEVLGNLTLKAATIQLLPGTIIHGDLLNRSKQSLPIPQGVEVRGERKQITDEATPFEKNVQQWKWMLLGLQFLSAYIIGLIFLRVVPRFTGQNVDLLLHHRNPALTIGLVSFLVMSFSGYFLAASVIGTGVGIFLLLVTGLMFYTGKIMVAYALGLLILRQKSDLSFGKLALGLFIGLVVLYSTFTLAYIGDMIYFMTSCWGLGSIIISIRNSQHVIKLEIPPSLKKHS